MKQLILIIFLIIPIVSFSQNSFNLGPDIIFGNNSFKRDGGIGLGGSIEIAHKFSDKSAVRFYTGFDNFHYYKFQYQDVGFLPIKVGYEYYLNNPQLNIFADAGIGKFFKTNNSTSLSCGLGISYRVKLIRMQFFQVSSIYNFNYNKIENTAWIDVRISYGIYWKKRKKL